MMIMNLPRATKKSEPMLVADVVFKGLLLGRRGQAVRILEVVGANLIIQNPVNGRKGIVKNTVVR
jgi:hypothetical protein